MLGEHKATVRWACLHHTASLPTKGPIKSTSAKVAGRCKCERVRSNLYQALKQSARGTIASAKAAASRPGAKSQSRQDMSLPTPPQLCLCVCASQNRLNPFGSRIPYGFWDFSGPERLVTHRKVRRTQTQKPELTWVRS